MKRVISLIMVLAMLVGVMPIHAVAEELQEVQAEQEILQEAVQQGEQSEEGLGADPQQRMPEEGTKEDAQEPIPEEVPEEEPQEPVPEEAAEEDSQEQMSEEELEVSTILTWEEYYYTLLASGAVSICGFEGAPENEEEPFLVEIPSEINGSKVTEIAEKAFAGNAEIEGLLLPETIEAIGNGAFEDCENLKVIAFCGEAPSFGESLVKDSEKMEEIFILDTCDFTTLLDLLKRDMGEEAVDSIQFRSFENVDILKVAFIASLRAQIENKIGSASVADTGIQEARSGENSIMLLSDAADNTVTPTAGANFNNHQYELYDLSMSWREAKEYCESLGGHLVTITSAEEQAFIESLLPEPYTKRQYWLGASLEDGAWHWVTGETFEYTNWDRNQPDHQSREEYAEIFNCSGDGGAYPATRYKWNDITHNNVSGSNPVVGADAIGFICEYEPEESLSGDVHYFISWDVENQIAYFGPGDMLGSQVTEETDVSFTENPTALLGQYVLAETKPRTDGDIGPDTLISVKAVESKTGTVIMVNENSITIGLETYSVPSDMVLPDGYAGNMVLYHLYNGSLVDIEVLETVVGTLTLWNAENRELTIALTDSVVDEVTYTLSNLVDEDTVNFLADGTILNTQVSCKVDINGLVYQVVRADNQFEMGRDNLRFLNSNTDFFSNEEITQGEKDQIKEKLSCTFLQKWAYEEPYERSTPYCYQITDESFNRLTHGMSNTVIGQLVQSRNDYWGGSCFGMSSVAAIRFLNTDRMPFERLSGTESPASSYNLAAPKDSPAVEDLINFYQLSQNLPITQRQIRNAYLQITEDYEGALDQIISALNQHSVVLAGIESDNGGHAVLLLPKIQSSEDYYDIAVYDPNKTEETTMRLYKASEASNGCIRIAYSGSQNVDTAQISYDRLYYYCTNVDQIDVKNYFGFDDHSVFTDYDRAIFNLEGDADVLWIASKASFSYKNGAVESLYNVIGPFSECRETTNGVTAGYISFMTDFQNLSGDVECNIAPRTANGCEMEFIFEGYSLSVNMETGAKITVDPQTANATVETDTPGKIGLLVVQDETSTQWPWYATAVDIGEAQRVVISISENGLQIESDGLDDISVAVKKENSFVQKDFSTDAQELNLVDGGDTIQVKDEHEHTYSTPTFTWFNDNICTATFICVDGDDVQTVDCTITSITTAPTETEVGKTVYTATAEFSGQTYTNMKTIPIPAANHCTHIPDTKWYSDGENHWHKCTGCDKKLDETKHSGGLATCTEKAVCDVCGVPYGELAPHAYENTWSQGGADGHWHECKNCSAHSTVVPHTPGAAATATTPQTCAVCGYVLTPAIGHTHIVDSTWHSNGTYHWHLCTSCGAWVSTSQHSYSGDADTTCNVCGYARTVNAKEPSEETTETVVTTEETEPAEATTAAGSEASINDSQENGERLLGNDVVKDTDSGSSGVSGILIVALVIAMIGAVAGLACLLIYKKRHE